MVGIFWIYEEEIYHKAVLVDSVTPVNGFVDSDLAHYEVWDEMQRKNPAFYLYEYEEILRGRVVYDVKRACHMVYANDAIINSSVQCKLIVETFGLDRCKTEFCNDEHYQLQAKEMQCNRQI